MHHTTRLAGRSDTSAAEFAVVQWRSFADLAGWDGLARTAAEPNSFAERWFVEAGLQAFDPADRVELATLRMGGRLTGIMPIARRARYERLPLHHLRNWLHPNAFCGLPLVVPGCEHAFWRGLLGWADKNCRTALFLHLQSIPTGGPLFTALREVCLVEGRQAVAVQRFERALLQSELSPEAYFDGSLTAKKRKELRRQFNRLSDEGTVEVLRHQGNEALDTWVENFLALEAAGWKGTEGSALACDPAKAVFFRNALAGAAASRRLDRLAITLDGRPIAMLANFLAEPGAFSFKTAYDERFARYSPGVLLQRENLSIVSREGIAWADSCAAPDHPMIDRIWREKREIARISIAIGGRARRAAAALLFRGETGRTNHLL